VFSQEQLEQQGHHRRNATPRKRVLLAMLKHRVRLAMIVVAVAAVVVTIGPWPVASLWRGSGITGQTTVGPTCPVSRPGYLCPPGHVRVWLVLSRADWPAIFSISRTDAAGRFRVGLPPGNYTLRVERPGAVFNGSQAPFLRRSVLPVRVHPHSFTTVPLGFDSGIR
jgi:hypothetical protein